MAAPAALCKATTAVRRAADAADKGPVDAAAGHKNSRPFQPLPRCNLNLRLFEHVRSDSVSPATMYSSTTSRLCLANRCPTSSRRTDLAN